MSQLYLTLVGGGVFRNPFSEVFAAMAAAHARWAPGTALRKVVLLLFTPDQNIISGVMAALKGQVRQIEHIKLSYILHISI